MLLQGKQTLKYPYLSSMTTATLQGDYSNYVRAKQVSQFLCCSEAHICKLAQEGVLPRVRIGRKAYAYDPIDILLYAIRGYCPTPPVAVKDSDLQA